jgi:hypothetical protein
MSGKKSGGQIAWVDLTVPQAGQLRDFYQQVVGWQPTSVSMGDYQDYSMSPAGSETPVAGICHARGVNQQIPPVWMIYITVDNLAVALEKCVALGGKILKPSADDRPYAIIEDPAGAICTLYQTQPETDD